MQIPADAAATYFEATAALAFANTVFPNLERKGICAAIAQAGGRQN